jgi:hypothetical protein
MTQTGLIFSLIKLNARIYARSVARRPLSRAPALRAAALLLLLLRRRSR